MARDTRARYELIKGEDNRPLWLVWLAGGNPAHRGKFDEPLIPEVARSADLPYKTLWGLANGSRTPTLETLGEIVDAGMYLRNVSRDEAERNIMRLVREPIRQAEAA